jgi:hypothetical protein
MKNKKLVKFASTAILTLTLVCLVAPIVLAQTVPTVKPTQDPKKLDVVTVIEKGINYALSLIGLIVVVLFVYAGFLWTTAAGNDDQIKKARGIMTSAVIGMVIAVLAYGIVKIVITGFGI